MLKILFENVIYRLFGFVPVYQYTDDFVIEIMRPSVIIEKIITGLVILVCVPCWVVVPLFFVTGEFPNLFYKEGEPSTMYLWWEKYELIYLVRKRDLAIFKRIKVNKWAYDWQKIESESKRIDILHNIERHPTKPFCKYGRASDCWRDKEIDEENFKEDCFIIRFKKRGGERMKKLVVTILTVVLLPLTTYADSNLVNQIMADATYEQSKGQTKGMDYCYTLESQQAYYKKYKPIVRDEGTAQRIELYIDSKCELGAYMYSNPDYDYKAIYSIQHPRVIINQILNRSKYGDKVHIRDWKDDRYR